MQLNLEFWNLKNDLFEQKCNWLSFLTKCHIKWWSNVLLFIFIRIHFYQNSNDVKPIVPRSNPWGKYERGVHRLVPLFYLFWIITMCQVLFQVLRIPQKSTQINCLPFWGRKECRTPETQNLPEECIWGLSMLNWYTEDMIDNLFFELAIKLKSSIQV